MQQAEATGPASRRTQFTGEEVVDTFIKSDLVTATTAFGFDLYDAVRRNADGNLLISPYSVFQALAMAFAGARGETATQIASALRFRDPRSSVHQVLATLTCEILARGNLDANNYFGFDAQHLRIANGIWGQNGYPLSPEYLAVLEQHYGTGVQFADFTGDSEAVRRRINRWVAEQTEGHIRQIAPPGTINPITRLVVANAIWFLGSWQDPFDDYWTQDDLFTLIDGTSVTVPFMTQIRSIAYARGDGFQAIEIPYVRNALTFTVLLPDKGNFTAFEAGLDCHTLNMALSGLTTQLVEVYLPRFELRLDMSLEEPLQAMGITDAFNPTRADFTATATFEPSEPLVIGKVLHSTYMRVDERGTKAAAATMAGVLAFGMRRNLHEPVLVRIDRPFIFAIRDTMTGTVLFLGRVLDPKT